MNDLAVIVATLHWNGWAKCVQSWAECATGPYTQRTYTDLSILEAYQNGFEDSPEPILGFLHDDCVCLEKGWDQRVLAEFADSNVGLVGFGGALGLGDIDIYKKPFEIPQLARHTFMSNMRDAEVHGLRFTGECDVSCLDGFAMFVRRKVLSTVRWFHDDRVGWPHPYTRKGWPLRTALGYFMYDAFLSCEVRRQGYRTRLVGVACDHLGGRSTGMGPHMGQEEFEAAHRYIFDTCRDVLPMRVP